MAEPLAARTTIAHDAAARQLTRIWEELLGIGSIGVDQNYFDLGGDSILAVHLFAEIDKVFKVRMPVASLYEAPTIEELARIICGQATASGRSPLVAIRPGGSRPPFFCMHGAGGTVLIYRALSQHLGPDQPFYGLQSQGLDGSCEPLTTVEEMAGLYVKEIRTVQRNGPYYLGGYCGGGTIAYEVAQLLKAEGEEIALLALLETSNWAKIPPPSFWAGAYQAGQRLAFHAANFFGLDSAGKAKFLSEKARIFRSRIPVWRGQLLGRFARRSRTTRSESRLLGRIWQANDRAFSTYVAKPYAGALVDIRPIREYRMFDRPEAKWDKLAGAGQRTVTLPVYPAGMLVEPFVKHLAEALRRSIDDAMREWGVAQSSSGGAPRVPRWP